MEAISWRVLFITAVAPVIWGSTYYVTRNYLPSDYPLTGAMIRALPAGLILLALIRKLPQGDWWWKSLLISALNISGFFILIYISGSRLPSSIASMVMALSPLMTVLMAKVLVNEQLTGQKIVGGLLGILGVCLLLGRDAGSIDALGMLASVAGMLTTALGFVLTRKWKPPVTATVFTAWQLSLGGLAILPFALLFEGALPAQPAETYLAYGYIVIFSSLVAYICWFYGLSQLSAGTVSIVGLLNPVAGVLLGTCLAGEVLSLHQGLASAVILLGIYWSVRVKKVKVPSRDS